MRMLAPALADRDGVALLQANEARGQVGSGHLVPLLETVVLLDVVQVVPTDRNRGSSSWT